MNTNTNTRVGNGVDRDCIR